MNDFITVLRVFLTLLPLVRGIAPPYEALADKAEIYTLPPLPYEYRGLEPWMDEATLRAHHEGHHDAYRKKMNAFLAQWRDQEPLNNFATEPLLTILRQLDKIPDLFQTKLKNNLGGFVNHCLYWAVMSPNPGTSPRSPSGPLLEEIKQSFGSFDGFKAAFTAASLDLFGSGYVWLVRKRDHPSNLQLSITTTTNQDCPLSEGAEPLLVIDIWEHAYYLKHQFRRAQYVNDWWMVVDWRAVEKLDKFWIDPRTHPRKHEEF
jgi:Fe-Mn family superoxide dismutase